MTRPGKIPSPAVFEPGIFRSRGGRLNHLASEAVTEKKERGKEVERGRGGGRVHVLVTNVSPGVDDSNEASSDGRTPVGSGNYTVPDNW